MCKKLLIAAIAIVVGLSVVKHTQLGSLINVWWNKAMSKVEAQVSLDDQIGQLKGEIDKIDVDIKRNLGKLASQEVDCQDLEKRVDHLRASAKQLDKDVADMMAALEAKTEKVSFKGNTYRPSQLARKLEAGTKDLKRCKTELIAKEQLLADKTRTLEVARDRVRAMRDQKEQLRVEVAQLETQCELLRLKSMEAKLDLDESQVGKCNDLARKIKTRLRKLELEAKLQADFGYQAAAPAVDNEPSIDEVLKAARKALKEDGDAVAAGK
jgi:chromosome segregation ATPase